MRITSFIRLLNLFLLQLSQDSKRASDSSIDKELQNVFENFDMSQIKNAGPIFDGFCVSSLLFFILIFFYE